MTTVNNVVLDRISYQSVSATRSGNVEGSETCLKLKTILSTCYMYIRVEVSLI